jgi:hypothetical protein
MERGERKTRKRGKERKSKPTSKKIYIKGETLNNRNKQVELTISKGNEKKEREEGRTKREGVWEESQ